MVTDEDVLEFGDMDDFEKAEGAERRFSKSISVDDVQEGRDLSATAAVSESDGDFPKPEDLLQPTDSFDMEDDQEPLELDELPIECADFQGNGDEYEAQPIPVLNSSANRISAARWRDLVTEQNNAQADVKADDGDDKDEPSVPELKLKKEELEQELVQAQEQITKLKTEVTGGDEPPPPGTEGEREGSEGSCSDSDSSSSSDGEEEDGEAEEGRASRVEARKQRHSADGGKQQEENGRTIVRKHKPIVYNREESPPRPTKKLNLCKDDARLQFFFDYARFFIIKSGNSENVAISKARSVWSTTVRNESILNRAFRECKNVILVFSVEGSQAFQGFCRMASESARDHTPINWVLPPRMRLGGTFKVHWINRLELPFGKTAQLQNPWNDHKPVRIARDGTEVAPAVGRDLCYLFPVDINVDLDKLTERIRREQALAPPLVATAALAEALETPREQPRNRDSHAPYNPNRRFEQRDRNARERDDRPNRRHSMDRGRDPRGERHFPPPPHMGPPPPHGDMYGGPSARGEEVIRTGEYPDYLQQYMHDHLMSVTGYQQHYPYSAPPASYPSMGYYDANAVGGNVGFAGFNSQPPLPPPPHHPPPLVERDHRPFMSSSYRREREEHHSSPRENSGGRSGRSGKRSHRDSSGEEDRRGYEDRRHFRPPSSKRMTTSSSGYGARGSSHHHHSSSSSGRKHSSSSSHHHRHR